MLVWWGKQRKLTEGAPSFYAELDRHSMLLAAASLQCSFILNAQSHAWPWQVQNRAQINQFPAGYCKLIHPHLPDGFVLLLLLYSEKRYTFICNSVKRRILRFYSKKNCSSLGFVIEAHLK